MKKTIIQILTVLFIIGCLFQFVFAGGIDNLQNFSAKYMATGSRNAATDGADIAAYNPAGIIWQKDGLTMEGDIQYLFNDFTHEYNDIKSSERVERSQDEPSIIPSFFTTYKSGKWGAFGSFTVNGGGGEVSYDKGNFITNIIQGKLIQGVGEMVPVMVNAEVTAGVVQAMGLPVGTTYDQLPAPAQAQIDALVTQNLPTALATAIPMAYLTNEKIEAESKYLTLTAGGAYQFNDQISGAAGIRVIQAKKSMEAFADTGGMGELIGGYDQEADGFGFVASVNFAPSKDLLFALRYESEVNLEFDTEYKNNTNALGREIMIGFGREDNGKYDRDLPGVIGLGASWNANDKLNLNASLTYYLQEDASWYGYDTVNQVPYKYEDTVDNGIDLGISATYALKNNFRISGGYIYTDKGVNAGNFDLDSMMSPQLNCHTVLLGFGYDFNEKSTIEFGVANLFYEPETGTFAQYDGLKSDFDRETTTVALAYIHRF